ncbi:hypothetical protein Ahy_A09g043032 [Arachis hypogaea]|uniref:Aminotransferase-like plant mobile domain-containing protein n=1 Tax=Arachis hypogaea TaxID=3818 RepID=A0A445BHI7_ARAHY|nr:hypothetical protein Ahy_A09g043032 [Arachis hypogaea]
MRRQYGMLLDEMIMPYLQMASLAHFARLNDHWFRLDVPLVNAFVERWCAETHSFHMPFEECTIMLQDETFSDLPHDVDEETIRKYARVYVMILLLTQLFDDKSGTRMYIRWLPYVARLEDMYRYNWESAALLWLNRCLCHMANRNVVNLTGLLQFL